VQEVHFDGTFIERLTRLTRQADCGRPLSYHEKVGVADVIALAIGHHQAKRLERSVTKCVV